MKIIHVLNGRCNPDSANGVDKTVYYLSKYQAEENNIISVFSVTNKTALPISNVNIETFNPARFPFQVSLKFRTRILECKPDIVHLHSTYIPYFYTISKILLDKNIPYVVTPHGGLSKFVTNRNRFIKIPYKFFFELSLLNNSVFVHSVGDADDILEYGVKVPIVTIPNGIVPFDTPEKDRAIAEIKKKLPIENIKDKRIFSFIGRLDPIHKGLDLLIQSCESLKSHNFLIVLIGPDHKDDRRKLESMVKRLGLSDKVFFYGPAFGDEKLNLLAITDVFLHTSRWEGLSFSVLEAAASGRPCLLTPAANPLGMLKKYNAGILVEDNVESIAEGLNRFLNLSNEEILNLGKNARKMVLKEFDWRNIAENMVQNYQKYTQ